MKNLKSFIATSIFMIALTSNSYGQYTFVLKGDKSPYDSGVVVAIQRYRMESTKLKLADRLIDSLVFEIKSITSENFKSRQLIAVKDTEISVLKKDRADQKVTITSLSDSFNALSKLEEDKWYKKVLKSPVTWFVFGVVTTKIISK